MPKQNTGTKSPKKQRGRYGPATSRVSKADRAHKLNLEHQRREQLLDRIDILEAKYQWLCDELVKLSWKLPGEKGIPIESLEGSSDLSGSSSEVQNGG